MFEQRRRLVLLLDKGFTPELIGRIVDEHPDAIRRIQARWNERQIEESCSALLISREALYPGRWGLPYKNAVDPAIPDDSDRA
jgi:hypothetical protein